MEAVNADMGLKTSKCPRIDDVMLGNQAVRQRAQDFYILLIVV